MSSKLPLTAMPSLYANTAWTCVVAAFNLHVSVIYIFGEIQRLLWQSFALALRILFVFLFLFFSHHLMFDQKNFSSDAYRNTFPPLHSDLPRFLSGSPPNRRKDNTILENIFLNLRHHIPFGLLKNFVFFFFSLSVLVVMMY